MRAVVTSIDARREGEFALLQLALPNRPVHNAGVLLFDPSSGKLHLRLRNHWEEIADPEELDVLSALRDDFEEKIHEMGGRRFLEWLEDTLSNALLLTGRERVAVDSFSRTLDRLFEEHVGRIEVKRYRTHLPLYSLRAAATRFGDEQQVDEEDWVRIPSNLRLNENMFVARVVGRSMEPRIPDGSLNVFRAPVVGSRQNKILLVELFTDVEGGARYTVKRYTSRKVQRSEDEWQHESIRLEPLNPEFSAFELEEGEFRTIAEWVQVLD